MKKVKSQLQVPQQLTDCEFQQLQVRVSSAAEYAMKRYTAFVEQCPIDSGVLAGGKKRKVTTTPPAATQNKMADR